MIIVQPLSIELHHHGLDKVELYQSQHDCILLACIEHHLHATHTYKMWLKGNREIDKKNKRLPAHLAHSLYTNRSNEWIHLFANLQQHKIECAHVILFHILQKNTSCHLHAWRRILLKIGLTCHNLLLNIGDHHHEMCIVWILLLLTWYSLWIYTFYHHHELRKKTYHGHPYRSRETCNDDRRHALCKSELILVRI